MPASSSNIKQLTVKGYPQQSSRINEELLSGNFSIMSLTLLYSHCIWTTSNFHDSQQEFLPIWQSDRWCLFSLTLSSFAHLLMILLISSEENSFNSCWFLSVFDPLYSMNVKVKVKSAFKFSGPSGQRSSLVSIAWRLLFSSNFFLLSLLSVLIN